MALQFKPIPANLAIDLYFGLVNARRLQLQPALNAAVIAVGVVDIDRNLQRLVPVNALTHLAGLGLRGERVFPVPVIIQHSPPLIGYYRMLLGLSLKEFGQAQQTHCRLPAPASHQPARAYPSRLSLLLLACTLRLPALQRRPPRLGQREIDADAASVARNR